MANLKTIAPAIWTVEPQNVTYSPTNLRSKFEQFADGQKDNRTLWFFVNLVVHGVLFLPLPAALMYYFDAPGAVLAVTMACFFTNLIANMGGAGIRATLGFFFASIAIHILMVVITLL